MKKFIFLIVVFLNNLIASAQSSPAYVFSYGGASGTDQFELDSASMIIIDNIRTFSNNSVIRKSTLSAFNYLQSNYNYLSINDSVRSIKYDGNNVYACYPTQILKISDTSIPSVVWTYSNTQISIASTPYSTAVPRFMNMELRHDTLFVLYNDGVIRPLLINKNSGAVIPNYSFNSTSSFICSSTVPCLKTVDMKVWGSKIFVYGSINTVANDFGAKLFSFDVSNGTLNSSYPTFYGYTFANSGFVNDIAFYNTKIYVGGSFGLVNGVGRKSLAVFDQNFNLLNDVIPYTVFDNTTELQGIRRLQMYGNLLVTLGVYHSVNNIAVSNNTVTPHFCQNYFNLNTKTLLPISTSTLVDLFPVCTKAELKVSYLYLYNSSYVNINSTSSSLLYMPPMTYGQHIFYPGSNSLSTNSIITICAPDNGSITFTAPIKYHCQVSNSNISLNNSWSYSGTGAAIVPIGNGNTAKLLLSAGATSGTLSVTGSNDWSLVSETMKLYINVLQKPIVTAAFINSDSITCSKPKIPFTFSISPASPFTPTWTCPDNTHKYNVNDSTKAFLPGYYKITAKGITGCLSSDSVYAKLDTLKPNVTLPSGQVYIKCIPDSSLLQGSTTSTGSVIWWRNALGNTIKFQPNYVKTIGNYYLVAKTIQNGCKDSSLYQVKDQTAPPNSKLTSHTYINPLIAIDTVTCVHDQITIIGASDTINTTVQWREIASPSFSANPITVSGQGNFKLYVNRSDNGCADSSKIIFVAQNNSIPGITILNANPSLNCSFSTATLNAITNNTAVILNWLSPASNTLSNPAIVNTIGKYYITAFNQANLCSKKDSVTIIQTNSLIVNAGNDTTVCKNNNALLTATAFGTLSGITYSWSEGSNGAIAVVIPTITTNFIVSASGPGGCIGYDTVKVIIPSDIQDSLVGFQNCDNTQFGSILVYAKGGIAPYNYSIDNGNTFVANNTFSNMAYGNYSVITKDSLGCQNNTTLTLNGNSNLPIPKFIASTFNFKSDTIVLVDLSNPRPDSVHWQLPPQMTKIGGTMFNALILVNDTGDYLVTLNSYYGTCILNTTKTIHFSQQDSLHATLTNANGIKKLVLYPNPNTGQFTVDVEFYKKQNSSLQIWDATPYQYFQQNFYETNLISLPVNISQLNNGAYVLKLIGEYDSRNVTFIISK